MKSQFLNASSKLAAICLAALSIAGCSKNNASPRAQLAGSSIPGVAANGTYIRGTPSQSFQCNINAPASSPNSPYNVQSPCFDANTYSQAQANGTLPAGAPSLTAQQIQQVAQSQGQGVQNPGQQGNPQGPNAPNVSIDITPDGKIVSSHFRLVGGIGQEKITDNCHFLKPDPNDIHVDSSDPNQNILHISRFLTPQYDRFDMFFDPKGDLRIAAQSANGQVFSKQSDPIPYTLNQADQSIEVGAFTFAGPANKQFIEMEKALGLQFGGVENMSERIRYGIEGSTAGDSNSSSGLSQTRQNPGFVLGPQATGNGANGDGYRSLPLSPIIDTPGTMALATDGFVAKIYTWIVQPQHITEIRVPEMRFQSNTFVSAKPDVCEGSGVGRFLELHLQPAQ